MILNSYERKRSPFLYVQFVDALGKRHCVKTPIRKTNPDKERLIALELNRIEAKLLSAGTREEPGGGWTWVPGWLKTKYRASAGTLTLRTYQAHWKWLARFLRLHKLSQPVFFERQDAFRYVDWRTADVKEKSGRSPTVNTALGELKLLGMILDEAKSRGLVAENAARKLGIEREETALKPAITNEELAIILPALKEKPAWMFRSFYFALQTGVRFNETRIPRRAVRPERNEIVFESPKGGRKKAFSIQIYPEVKPVIDGFLASGEARLWDLPPKDLDFASLQWTRFFRELGLPHLCFHCTRVTFITRGAEAGVPEAVMMKMVNHASKEIHRVYQRLSADGSLAFRAKIAIPTVADATW